MNLKFEGGTQVSNVLVSHNLRDKLIPLRGIIETFADTSRNKVNRIPILIQEPTAELTKKVECKR